jgi:hypothetical protein
MNDTEKYCVHVWWIDWLLVEYTGILALPFAFKQSGYVLGLLLLILFGVVRVLSLIHLIYLFHSHIHIHTLILILTHNHSFIHLIHLFHSLFQFADYTLQLLVKNVEMLRVWNGKTIPQYENLGYEFMGNTGYVLVCYKIICHNFSIIKELWLIDLFILVFINEKRFLSLLLYSITARMFFSVSYFK